jgi:hypothetical protein
MAIWNPRQIAAENIDSERGRHEHSAYPEAPVTVHPPPVWAGIGLPGAAAVSFRIVLVSSHLFSMAALYRPPRAALLQSAR